MNALNSLLESLGDRGFDHRQVLIAKSFPRLSEFLKFLSTLEGIRNQRLFIHLKFDTFDSYARAELGLSEKAINNMITLRDLTLNVGN